MASAAEDADATEESHRFAGRRDLLPAGRHDHRPDERLKHSLFGQVRHHFARDFIDGSYRFMTDDWGVTSRTVDLCYRWKVGEKSSWQPHLRYDTQTAADFYVYSLTDGAALSSHATADYRLGEFAAKTD